jgi:hypothetical protein
MTTIRWKNGGPLFLQPAPGSPIGLFAADQNCCCPPPPPERCWCGSTCSYFIELVEPSEIAVRTPTIDCAGGINTVSVRKDSLLQDIVPIQQGDTGDFSFPPSYSLATATNTGILGVSVVDEIAGFPTFLDPSLYYFQLLASRQARVFVSCVNEVGQPKYYATISLSVSVYYRFESLGFTPLGQWGRFYSGTFEIPATCVVAPERECFASDQDFLQITTPLEITLSGDGTCSLGTLTMSEGGAYGLPPEFPYAKDAVDAILDATSYTFRITSLPSCEITDCNCGQSLTGVSLRLNGETFTVGNEPNPDRGFEQQVWSYTDSASNPVIEYKVWDAFFLEEQYYIRAEIFCDSEQQAGGNVGPFERDAWYVIAYNDCFEWENGVVVAQTRNTYVGAYECYEHCGKFLPSGTPLQMYLVSSVTTPGLASCDPPPSVAIVVGHEGCPE